MGRHDTVKQRSSQKELPDVLSLSCWYNWEPQEEIIEEIEIIMLSAEALSESGLTHW